MAINGGGLRREYSGSLRREYRKGGFMRQWHHIGFREFADAALPEVARQRGVSRKRCSAVTTLARLQRRVARDLVLATLSVAAELCAADAAHVAEAFVFDADVAT